MGIKIMRRCCAGLLLGLPCALLWAQDLPPPAERVQRQAESPLRWIIEAGKLKGRIKPAAETDAAVRASGDKPAARTAQAKLAVRSKETASSRAANAPAASASSAAADAATRVAAAEAAPPSPPEALELVSDGAMVLPEAISKELRTDAEVELQFTVNADGSVSDVSVQSSNNPNVDLAAVKAVRGWRFKPIAQAQVHSVQLVFHPRP
jgi:TonB family protein